MIRSYVFYMKAQNVQKNVEEKPKEKYDKIANQRHSVSKEKNNQHEKGQIYKLFAPDKKKKKNKNINDLKKTIKNQETKPQHNGESISIKDTVNSLQPLFEQQQHNLTTITEEDVPKKYSNNRRANQCNDKPIFPSPSGQPLIGHQNDNNSLTVDSLKDYCDKVNTIIKQHPSSIINMNVIDDHGKTLKLQFGLGNEFVISNDQQMVYIFGENNYLAYVLLIDQGNTRIFREYKNIHRLTQEHPLPIGKYGQKGNKTTYANLFLKRKYMEQQNNKNNKQINNQQGKSYRKKNNINK